MYGCPKANIRVELWKGLKNIALTIQEPWVVAGDFNAFVNHSEKCGALVEAVWGVKNSIHG